MTSPIKITVLIIAISLSNHLLAAEELTFATGFFAQHNNSNDDSYKLFIRQIYKTIGIDTHFLHYPAERSLRLSNSGQLDGEVIRIKGLERKYPNLRMIPTPIHKLEVLALSVDLDVEITDWQDLSPYKIGILTGIKYSEKKTKNMEVHRVTHIEQLLKMLAKNRLDIVLCMRIPCLKSLIELKLDNIKVIGSFDSVPLFHYIHRKHEAIIPLVDAEIIKFKNKGVLAAIKKKSIVKLLKDINESPDSIQVHRAILAPLLN